MHLALDLILLGFTSTPIRPDERLFQKPNNKLLEEILYFLYSTYDHEQAEERFRSCWPASAALLSKKFKTEVLKWNEELRKNDSIPRECQLRKSWLDESIGERLEESLASFAEFLLSRKYKEEGTSPSFSLSTAPCIHALECFLPNSDWQRMNELKLQVDLVSNRIDNL